MSKKTLRIITVLATIVATLCMSNFVFADLTPGSLTATQPTGTDLQNVGQRIMGFIQVIGIIVSVAILMILGIKYMMGSAEEKAEYKKVFIPYIVGAILLFSATTIANAIYNAVQQQ